jgi:hypothetical protein
MRAYSAKLFPLLILTALLFCACKEENPGVIFTEPEKPLLDTTYILGTAPAAQTKRVLLIDITGVRCVNCPKAAKEAHKLDSLNPGRVSVIAAFPFSPGASLTEPWGPDAHSPSGYDTLVTADAEALVLNLGNVSSLPTGAVDQIKESGSYFIPFFTWASTLNAQLAKSSPVNIDLKNSWSNTSKTGRTEIKVTCTEDIGGQKLFYIAVLEDGIVGKQSDNQAASGHVEEYEFHHVLRKLYTLPTGDSLNQTLVKGRVFEKHYSIKPRYNWKPANLIVMVWVVDAATKEVLHVAEAKLIP